MRDSDEPYLSQRIEIEEESSLIMDILQILSDIVNILKSEPQSYSPGKTVAKRYQLAPDCL